MLDRIGIYSGWLICSMRFEAEHRSSIDLPRSSVETHLDDSESCFECTATVNCIAATRTEALQPSSRKFCTDESSSLFAAHARDERQQRTRSVMSFALREHNSAVRSLNLLTSVTCGVIDPQYGD